VLCCPSCGSRFFKTLELRFELLNRQIQALLYKKRCKRCKAKYLFEMTVVNGQAQYALAESGQWRRADRIQGCADPFAVNTQCSVVSDYTRFISTDTAKIFDQIRRRENQ
jgi:hypothetical protein